MRVNRGRVAAYATLLALTQVAACELVLGELPTPQEDLTTTESVSAGGSPATGGGGQGGAGTGAGVITSSGGGGSASTSSASASGGGSTTSTGEGGACCSECDCDCDGFPASGACAGTAQADCDDATDKVFPGEPTYYVEPSPNNGFDWDCSGVPERDPALLETIDCASLLGLGCNEKIGFLGATVPMCGEAGTWGTCKKSGITCVPDPIEDGKKMACK